MDILKLLLPQNPDDPLGSKKPKLALFEPGRLDSCL